MKSKLFLNIILSLAVGSFIGYTISKQNNKFIPYEGLNENKISDTEFNIKIKQNIDSRIKYFDNNKLTENFCSSICQNVFTKETNYTIESNETKHTEIKSVNDYNIGYTIYDCNCSLKK
jgi:hypothetical protein